MRIHEYTRSTGEVVEFHRDVNSRDLHVIIDTDPKSPIRLSCSAPLSDFQTWDTIAYQRARRWERNDQPHAARSALSGDTPTNEVTGG